MKSISEGTEVSAQDAAITRQQLTGHAVKVWIYNSQNVTPPMTNGSASTGKMASKA